MARVMPAKTEIQRKVPGEHQLRFPATAEDQQRGLSLPQKTVSGHEPGVAAIQRDRERLSKDHIELMLKTLRVGVPSFLEVPTRV
jgi:hypothetical protein